MTTATPSITPPPALAASRIGFFAAVFVLAAITVVAIAPQQKVIVASMAVTEGVPLIGWGLAAFGFGAIALRRAETPAAETLLSLVTRIALGLGVMSMLALLLGVLGILNQLTAVAMFLIGSATAVWRIYNNRNTIAAWLREPPGAAWLLLLIAPIVGIIYLGNCCLPGLLWGLDDPSGYDVAAYHLQLPREWFELGRVTTLDHNVFSFFSTERRDAFAAGDAPAWRALGGDVPRADDARRVRAAHRCGRLRRDAITRPARGERRGHRRCWRPVDGDARRRRIRRRRVDALRDARDGVGPSRTLGAGRRLRRSGMWLQADGRAAGAGDWRGFWLPPPLG